MPKSDHKFYNQSQEHEQNYHLKKNGLKQTQDNRDILNQITPANSKNVDVDDLIQKNIEKFEKA